MKATILLAAKSRISVFMAIFVAGLIVCTVLLLVRDGVSPAEASSAKAVGGQAGASVVDTARVRIEAVGTQRSGLTGRPRLETGGRLAVGQSFTRFLRSGEAAANDVCNARFMDSLVEADYAILWKLEVNVVEIRSDRTTINVHWTRARAGHETQQEKDDVRTIALAPADSHVLDYVENGATASCASLLIRISAQPILEQPERPISVDVWTVDENAAGETRSVHQRVSGATGRPIAFKFHPLAFSTPDGTARVNIDVEGTLQAVAAEDGQVDVSVQAQRRTAWGGAETRGEGRVQFRAAIGETAALLLPQPTGTLGRSSPTAAPASLDLARTFAGHRLSLYVKIESLE